MPLTKEQRAQLERYIAQGDRSREPVFAGREREFRLVADNARAAREGHPGRVLTLHGPPGIGKTAFLTELGGRTQGRGERPWGGPPMACVSVSPHELHDARLVLMRVAESLPAKWRPGEAAFRRLGRMLPAWSLSFGVSGEAFGAGGGFGLELRSREEGDEAPANRAAFPWREMREMLNGIPEDGVIALCVDEAHELEPTPGKDRNLLLFDIHQGPPAPLQGKPPVVAVLAGHSTLPDKLRKTLSGRQATDNVAAMRLLGDGESLEYARGMLDWVGAEGAPSDRQAAARWVAGECGGWPHHLRNAMASVAQEALRADSLAIADWDGQRIEGELHRRRAIYYKARLSAPFHLLRQELSALYERWDRLDATLDEAQAAADARRLLAGLDPDLRTTLSRHGIVDGESFVRGMQGMGLLAACRSEDDALACPIDSLRTWIKDGAYAGRGRFPRISPSPAFPGDAESA